MYHGWIFLCEVTKKQNMNDFGVSSVVDMDRGANECLCLHSQRSMSEPHKQFDLFVRRR